MAVNYRNKKFYDIGAKVSQKLGEEHQWPNSYLRFPSIVHFWIGIGSIMHHLLLYESVPQ